MVKERVNTCKDDQEREHSKGREVNNIPCCQKVPTLGTGKLDTGSNSKQWAGTPDGRLFVGGKSMRSMQKTAVVWEMKGCSKRRRH